VEFLARSDDRIERLRGEHTATLDRGRYVLAAALDLDMEDNPLLQDQLTDMDFEVARRAKAHVVTTTHVPERGNPVAQDFDDVPDEELERELHELGISYALSARDCAAHVAIVNRMQVIDAELARRAEERHQ
jgi:hypothetical protein